MNGGWINEGDLCAAGQKTSHPAASIHPAAHGNQLHHGPWGISPSMGTMRFSWIRPDKPLRPSEDAIRQRVGNLANLISNRDEVTLLALTPGLLPVQQAVLSDPAEEETEPSIRRLLQLDLEHLDEIQASSASKREFVIALRVSEKERNDPAVLHQMEKEHFNENIRSDWQNGEDIKRLLSVYYLGEAA